MNEQHKAMLVSISLVECGKLLESIGYYGAATKVAEACQIICGRWESKNDEETETIKTMSDAIEEVIDRIKKKQKQGLAS